MKHKLKTFMETRSFSSGKCLKSLSKYGEREVEGNEITEIKRGWIIHWSRAKPIIESK